MSDRPFTFLSGRPCLALAETWLAAPNVPPIELLASADRLSSWLVAAGVVDAEPMAGERDLATARRLRDAVRTLADDRVDGRALDGNAVALLNEVASHATVRETLSAGGRSERVGSAPEALSALARDAVRLFGSEDASRLGRCSNPECRLVFFDTSRRRERRWCDMTLCGNRAKVRALRARRKQAPPSD